MNIIDLDNQTTLNIDTVLLEKIATVLSRRKIELIITDDESIQALNAEYRGKNSTTDVLSFPMENADISEELSHFPLGSIVISADHVETKATHFGHTAENECALLFIHGLFHLLGYDHETDGGEMRRKEREIIQAFNLPDSLIIRTEES